MVSSVLLLGGAIALYAVFSVANGLRANVAKARKSGLPFIVVPMSPFNRFWQLTFGIWVRLIKLLPRRFWQDWIFVMLPDWSYRDGQEPYKRFGNTFLVISPGQMIMWTQDAGAIREISLRREHFPKPIEVYGLLSLFGQNVVTTEAGLWRLHRKATSPSFNERNAAYTFAEAIHQAQGMVAKWMGPDGKGRTITTLEHDTMTLALNVICYVGFGLRFFWPGQAPPPEETDPRMEKYGVRDPPPGHTMTFAQSVEMVMARIVALLLMPTWLLRNLPFRALKEAAEASDNYTRYMNELLEEKKAGLRKGDGTDRQGMDLMGALVRAKYQERAAGGGGGGGPELSDSDIVGNAFIMLIAGHETTANALHFTLIELANNPAAQRALQADVDRLFGDTDPAGWNYEANIAAMQASHLGACMNETLRMIPSVVEIPKKVSPAQDQVLTLEGSGGRRAVLPAGMTIALSAVAVQRNPRYWPGRPSRLTGEEHDLNDYVPERWFRSSGSSNKEKEEEEGGEQEEDFGGPTGPDTSASLFRPVRGSFVPFSEGARSCLGRRIAVVEMMAALAVIFQRYSIELAVDEWASDAEVAAMSRVQRAKLYQKAQARSRDTIRGAGSIVTLKLQGGAHVPVRVVRRGEERFVDFMDP